MNIFLRNVPPLIQLLYFYQRPQGQTVGRSKGLRVRFKIDTPAEPQSPPYKVHTTRLPNRLEANHGTSPERPYREDKARPSLPLASYRSIHFKPGEPPTHQRRSKPRKSGPDAQSSFSIALPAKGEIPYVRPTHKVTVVLFGS
jgi:hypothetical protein